MSDQRDAIAGKGQYALAILAATVTKLTVPDGANYAFITVETGTLRWTDDGTTPSGTVGHVFPAGTLWEYDGQPQDLKLYSTAGATIHVSYYQ